MTSSPWPRRGKPSVQELLDSRDLIDQAVPGVVRELQYGVREGGDGDEVYVDAEVLFQFLDEQSRSLRDFLQSARRVA